MAHHSSVWGSLEASAPQHPASKKLWLWAISIAFAAPLVAAAIWFYFPGRNSQVATTPAVSANLSLELQRAGSDFRVTWDAASPAIRAAKRGTLVIKDGGFEKELQLDRDQLLSAGLVYSPATTDVSFRLQVYGAGPEPAVATVRLLAGSRPQETAEAPTTEVTAAPEAPPAEAATTATTDPATQPAPADPGVQPPADQPAQSAEKPASDPPATMAAAPQPAAGSEPAR